MPKNTVTESVREVNDGDVGFLPFNPSLVYSRQQIARLLHISPKTLGAMIRAGMPEIVPAAPGKPGKCHLIYGHDLLDFCRRQRKLPKKE